MKIDKKRVYIIICVAVLLIGIALGIYFLIHKGNHNEPAYTETSWVTDEEGYRCRTADDVCEITVNGGESFREILSEDTIREYAQAEVKKEKYKGTYHQDALYTDISSVALRIGNTVVTENVYSYYPAHLGNRSSCIYCLRIMDENDPLNSVILYYDAYTGALLEWESLSD